LPEIVLICLNSFRKYWNFF